MAISLTHTFVAGTRIIASQVNANFSTLATNALDKRGDTMTGNLLFTDASYDIGAAGATRPRHIYQSGNLTTAGTADITGNTTVGGTLAVTGATTVGGDLALSSNANIRRTTSDGSDSGSIVLVGGGSSTQARGGQIVVYGNEHASTGKVQICSGNVTGSRIEFIRNSGSVASYLDGPLGVWSNLAQVLDRDVTATTVASTTDETTVYSYTVPAGTMGTTRSLRLTWGATIVNTDGNDRTTNIEIGFGGADLVSQSLTFTNATTNEIQGYAIITNMNSATAQRVYAFLSHAHTAGGTAWVSATPWMAGSAAAVATGSDATINIRATHSVSSASYTFTLQYAILELI
jgi:hypothetical protein